jgi:diacylglycerol kinase
MSNKIYFERKSIKRSFYIAFRGLKEALYSEPSFKYMIFCAILVILGMVYFKTSRSESAVLIVITISVLALEVINTLFERVLDIIQPQPDERVKKIKDLMAALVLLASIGAASIGIIIFLPYIKTLFTK